MSNELESIIKRLKIKRNSKQVNNNLLNRIKKKEYVINSKKIQNIHQKLPLIEKIKKEYKKVSSAPYFNLNNISEGYNVLLADKSIENPFILNSELVKIIKDYTADIKNDEEKAKRIFSWIHQNIDYDNLRNDNKYQNSKETLERKLGICGEMAFLYITMARAAGLKSKYVSVKVDCDSKKVNHGCAVVYIQNNPILVDIAYNKFDIHHKKYNILNDNEITENFIYWRNEKS
ncbi:MAG: transglutaminase-like domain-containing protein [Nanoarchaeota archaeon]|nr:transglutaminase-like domain-containing protein [Nanoarchaeota archaeon]